VEDERLVVQALGGDRRAFEAIVRRHQRALISHLYRITGQRDAALDLAQEVFLKVYTSLGSYDPRFRFTTWLYRIASNSAIDLLRRREPRTCHLTGEAADDAPDGAHGALAGREPTPDEMLRARELQTRLEAAIRRLPTEYRQLILLRHRQHCRYDEIARITNLPLGTVKNRIFRAREILRGDLADVLDTET
jgi:RNA polymerase sigma-70 factor (ECF subfamily)